MITRHQIRAGRALLDWAIADLAEESRVAPGTIFRIENANCISPSCLARSMPALQKALERNAVQFIPDGVRLLPGGPEA